MATATVVNETDRIDLPAWIVDLASFRRWVQSEDCPESARIDYIKGRVWIDMSREQIFSHLRIKSALNYTIEGIARKDGSGLYIPDGLRVTNSATNLSAVPDGTYVANATIAARRVRFVEGREDGYTELQGVPDLVIEVVSNSSEDKDSDWLMTAYYDAEISEYWVVDARKDPLKFDVFRRTAKEFVSTRKQGGWVKSAVLGKSFRFVPHTTPQGHPDYTLSAR
jgi:Uma2 family endonuclease